LLFFIPKFYATCRAWELQGAKEEVKMTEKEKQISTEEEQQQEKEGQEETSQEEQETKTYTEEEVQEMLQKETDRRVSEAIKKREQTLREEMEEKLKKEREEAERLAKLSEKEKEKELLEKNKKDLERWEKELKRKELLSDTKDILHDKGIPVKFADILVRDDAQNTHEKINDFEKEWQAAIDKAVEERVKGKTPRAGGDHEKEHNPWLKDTFNLTEQGRILKEDPERAERLKKKAGVK